MTKFKNAQVVMLTMKDVTNIIKDHDNKLSYNDTRYLKEYQHLYIVNNDKIKIGDYYINNGNLLHCSEIKIRSGSKKVIASTNTNLTIGMTEGNVFYINLPQPSDSFIQKYIKSYNAKNVITDVLVEYNVETLNEDWSKKPVLVTNRYDLKINDKLNTITIKEINNSYSKEEVIEFAQIYLSKRYDNPRMSNNDIFDNWITKNL